MKHLTCLLIFCFALVIIETVVGQGMPSANDREYIYAIKKNQTGSGFTEVHVLNRHDWFHSYVLHAVTPIEQDWDNRFEFPCGDFNVYGTYYYDQPIWAIKKFGTGSGHTEIHILRPPNYNTFITQIVTSLPETNSKNIFLVAPYGNPYDFNNLTDLWMITLPADDAKPKPYPINLRILSGESGFQTEIVNMQLPVGYSSQCKYQFSLAYRVDRVNLFVHRIWDYSGLASIK